MRLTKGDIDFYQQNGFLPVPDAIPGGRVRAMRERMEALCEQWEGTEARRLGVQQESDAGGTVAVKTSQTVRKLSFLAHHEPLFRQYVNDPALLDLVEAILGRPLALYADEVFLKPPYHGSAKLPHQDNAYFGVRPDGALLTVWCALDDATVDNGCLHYIAGSHRRGRLEHKPIPGTPHQVPDGVEPEEAVAVPMRAGGVILHHALVLHFSPPNRTPFWRRAYTCHFIRADAEERGTRDAAAPPIEVLRDPPGTRSR